ncbi:MAG: LacI family DNA-binding transcriptional regulator [Bacteroidota bacterium]
MKGRRVTIKDIAAHLKMSTSTVSRALANHSDVSRETRDIVLQLAEEWDYQPDPIAVSLRQKRTHTLGVIIPQINNRFFSKAISGIQEVANANGYNVMITQSEESFDLEKKNVQAMMNNRVDGLIVALSKQTTYLDHFQKVFDSETPVVFFDRVGDSTYASKVIIDDYEASYSAVQHLIKEGCKRIAHVAGPQNLQNSRKRLEGYKDALKDNSLYQDNNLLVFSEYHTKEVRRITDYFLSIDPLPDAIFAINDAFAIEMICYLKKSGIRIPDDIAVVGFNNDNISPFIDPPLTSVESPAQDLGVEAAKLLLQSLDEEQAELVKNQSKVIKSRLIIRESSIKSGQS